MAAKSNDFEKHSVLKHIHFTTSDGTSAMPGCTPKIPDINELADTAQRLEHEHLDNMKKAFRGIKIVRSEYIKPNEWIIICGSELFDKLTKE